MDIDYSHYIVVAGIGWIAGNIYNWAKSALIGWYYTRKLNKMYAKGYPAHLSDIYYDPDFDFTESETPIGDRLAKEMGL